MIRAVTFVGGTPPYEWMLIFGSLAVLAGAVLLGRCLLTRRLVAVTVYGASMEPTYRGGDRVLVRRGSMPATGHVVVVEYPTLDGTWPLPPLRDGASASEVGRRRWLIKRVAAVPGDPVPRDRVPALAEERVPPGMVVLLGDNPDSSFDSRRIGYFAGERILGAVLNARRSPSA
ncbi:S26 family signal peptidase [Micromonospora saelicesensis]|uniref:S26 family signal peptidase n=1 Tax=Micromonospora saelicesensis TaxID=285676 RepID=UPI003CEE397D